MVGGLADGRMGYGEIMKERRGGWDERRVT